MHILVVNDDGPPSQQWSPYVHHFVRALQVAGHTVSVVLPDVQRSWIGKAHFGYQDVETAYFTPGRLSFTDDTGRASSKPLPQSSTAEEWLLVKSTPAACVQVGLHHHFVQTRGEIDLVVSGPNRGHNMSAVFGLASGTIGAALEAAICGGHRGVAISFDLAPKSGIHEPVAIKAAIDVAVRLVNRFGGKNEKGESGWPVGADVVNVNIPLEKDVGERKMYWTDMLENTWVRGNSMYTHEPTVGLDDEQDVLVDQEEPIQGSDVVHQRFKPATLRWNPNYHEVHDAANQAGPGNDGWTILNRFVSITPLKAAYRPVPHPTGEFKM